MGQEVKKREDIATNFQNHITMIQKQMEEEVQAMVCTDTVTTTNDDGSVTET